MKRRKRDVPVGEIPKTFTRGFVATALLVALRDRAIRAPRSGRTILRYAIQGGAALAAGTVAAEALARRNFGLALTATAAGAASLLAAEALLHHQDDNEENGRGQEEA